MTNPLRKGLAVCAALALSLGLAACSSDSQSGESGAESGSSESGEAAPTVDRSGDANFPDVTGDFGEEPTISAGSGTEPTQISVRTLSEGDGDEVSSDDFLLVNYSGALWNGKVFDSSFTNGSPAAFGLNQVIEGWKYGLAEQHVGDRVQLVIPSEWGYGETGSGDAQSGEEATIPANATLVFVVDIIDSVDPSDTSALTDATATDDALPSGISVEGDLGSEPTLTFSGTTQPGDSETTLAAGSGEEITDSDYVVYHAVGGYFGEDSETSGTWPDNAQMLSPGVTEMVGKTVGSRVLIVYGPTADASQSGATDAETKATVMVVDIVGVLHDTSAEG